MNTPFEWNPETEARLFELWKAGHPGSVIANIMRAPSRSAVIGKLHRLGYTATHPEAPERVKKIAAQPKTRQHGGVRWLKVGRKDKPVTIRAGMMANAAVFPIQMNPTRLLDLTANQCRFPIDDINTPGTAETLFCGAHQRDGSSYCEHHHARCMTPYKRSKKPRERSGFIARDKFVFGVAA